MTLGEKGTVVTVALVLVGAFILGRCTAPEPPTLPPKVAAAHERYVIQKVVDSAAILELQGQNARLKTQRDSQVAITKATDSAAMKQRRRADTLQAVAIAALTAADSASAWHAAHDARKLEADSAEAASAAKTVIIRTDSARFVVKDSIIGIERRGRQQADSLVAQLLPLAQHRYQCKIAWVINCPTRKQVFVGGMLAGVAGYAVASGRIRIPIPLRF